MNGWLMLWLVMIALGPIGIALAVAWERKTDMEMDSLVAFLVVGFMLGSSMVGAFGLLSWLIVWMFG